MTESSDPPGPREVDGVFKMPINLNDINLRSWGSEERLERYTKGVALAMVDARKNDRYRAQCCKSCYYLRINVAAGQSFTSKPCKRWGCLEQTGHSNTDVPEYCVLCADKFGICRRCGADSELKERKSLKPPKRTPDPPTIEAVRLQHFKRGLQALRQKKLPWDTFQVELDALMKKCLP